MTAPFHLAIPVHNLAQAAEFYGGVLELERGRYSDEWIDWNLFGHQLVTHLVFDKATKLNHNAVDGKSVPVPHFGVVLPLQDFDRLAQKLVSKNVDFVIAPYTRFQGEVGEQSTMFFLDPSGNALEFKAFRDLGQLFQS